MEKSTRTVLRGGNGGNAISLTRPWKKGQTYGTILVDLELHRPVDLLPDRAEETFEAWLRAHPQVELNASMLNLRNHHLGASLSSGPET